MKVKLKQNVKVPKVPLLKKGMEFESDYIGNQLVIRYKFGRYIPVEHNQVQIIQGYEPF